jgi:hypothetical protein
MGTSISQPSPRNTNWKPVHVSYQNPAIPDDRIINEIWRATENEQTPMSKLLKTEAIYNCYNAVKSSETFQQAMEKFTNTIVETKSNTLITEFAKRAIPSAFQSNQPVNSWASGFLSEVTNYIISRDTCGFVGDKYRNKTVNDLIKFKTGISNKVSVLVSSEKSIINSQKDWNLFIDKSVQKLKARSKNENKN